MPVAAVPQKLRRGGGSIHDGWVTLPVPLGQECRARRGGSGLLACSERRRAAVG